MRSARSCDHAEEEGSVMPAPLDKTATDTNRRGGRAGFLGAACFLPVSASDIYDPCAPPVRGGLLRPANAPYPHNIEPACIGRHRHEARLVIARRPIGWSDNRQWLHRSAFVSRTCDLSYAKRPPYRPNCPTDASTPTTVRKTESPRQSDRFHELRDQGPRTE